MRTLMERDGLTPENWYIIALSREIGRNQVINRIVYDQSLAVFRDKHGKASALEDRCLHRGTKISEGSCGPKGLTCPYHGWTFNSSGLVVSIPSEGPESAESISALQNRKWKIRNYPVIEQDGAIWAWMGAGKPLSALPLWRFPFSQDPGWTSYFMITDFDNEVSQLAQNFMDVPHTVFVHQKWFRERKMLEVPFILEVGEGRVKATYHKPNDSIGKFMSYFINPRKLPMVHTDEFIFPNLTRVDYRFEEHGFVINSQCTPVSSFKSKVYTWIAYRGNALAPLVKPLVQFYTRKVILEDVEIMKNQGDNLKLYASKPAVTERSTSADEIHLAIQRMRDAGSAGQLDLNAKITFKERTFWI